jgi:hypothetical protein
VSHTFALLEVSPEAYAEIAAKLREAGYDHAFYDEALDMHGIALIEKKPPKQTVLEKLTLHEDGTPRHVCGLMGYNGMIDPPCPGCEHWRTHSRKSQWLRTVNKA